MSDNSPSSAPPPSSAATAAAPVHAAAPAAAASGGSASGATGGTPLGGDGGAGGGTSVPAAAPPTLLYFLEVPNEPPYILERAPASMAELAAECAQADFSLAAGDRVELRPDSDGKGHPKGMSIRTDSHLRAALAALHRLPNLTQVTFTVVPAAAAAAAAAAPAPGAAAAPPPSTQPPLAPPSATPISDADEAEVLMKTTWEGLPPHEFVYAGQTDIALKNLAAEGEPRFLRGWCSTAQGKPTCKLLGVPNVRKHCPWHIYAGDCDHLSVGSQYRKILPRVQQNQVRRFHRHLQKTLGQFKKAAGDAAAGAGSNQRKSTMHATAASTSSTNLVSRSPVDDQNADGDAERSTAAAPEEDPSMVADEEDAPAAASRDEPRPAKKPRRSEGSASHSSNAAAAAAPIKGQRGQEDQPDVGAEDEFGMHVEANKDAAGAPRRGSNDPGLADHVQGGKENREAAPVAAAAAAAAAPGAAAAGSPAAAGKKRGRKRSSDAMTANANDATAAEELTSLAAAEPRHDDAAAAANAVEQKQAEPAKSSKGRGGPVPQKKRKKITFPKRKDCGKCNNLKKTGQIMCSKCEEFYYLCCMGLEGMPKQKEKWQCPRCTKQPGKKCTRCKNVECECEWDKFPVQKCSPPKKAKQQEEEEEDDEEMEESNEDDEEEGEEEEEEDDEEEEAEEKEEED